MRFLDKLKDAATKAVSQATEGAERLAKHVAAHGPGFIGESAAELLAEREYHRARELTAAGLTPQNAAGVVELLAPYANVDGTRIILINRLLGDACLLSGREPEAERHFRRALELWRDAAYRQDAEPLLIEEMGPIGDDYEAQILVALATILLHREDWDGCIRYSLQALQCDHRQQMAVYLQGVAMLRKGLPRDMVAEVFAKALSAGDQRQILAWVAELLPEHMDWFRRMVG
jgi:tetratricopeptide (TPR) repeat protein